MLFKKVAEYHPKQHRNAQNRLLNIINKVLEKYLAVPYEYPVYHVLNAGRTKTKKKIKKNLLRPENNRKGPD